MRKDATFTRADSRVAESETKADFIWLVLVFPPTLPSEGEGEGALDALGTDFSSLSRSTLEIGT